MLSGDLFVCFVLIWFYFFNFSLVLLVILRMVILLLHLKARETWMLNAYASKQFRVSGIVSLNR